MEIEKPRTGYLYVFDREILHIGKTVAIGRITVEVNAKNANKIEFYVDDELKFIDDISPYQWIWIEISFGKYELKVIAHGDGNEAEDTIDLWKFL